MNKIYQNGIYFFYAKDHLGKPINSASSEQNLQPYKYSGKEQETMMGLAQYDFHARTLDYTCARFTTPDPLAEKYYSISPYAYCLNNPVNFFDPNGLYPKSILTYDSQLGLHGGYKFTQSAAHLLSLVSGVSRVYIDNTVVQERAAGQYRPFYSAKDGGGAITLGSGVLNSNITYTENFFNDDPASYNGHGYGQDVMSWLSLSSHEVGHLPQISKAGGLLSYLFGFAKEYVKSGHDDAPSEIEADKGYHTFNAFNSFVNKRYGSGSMEKLFNSDMREGQRVETITNWWNAYQDTQKAATNSFLNNF
jgi:RHS repeat-associated protein